MVFPSNTNLAMANSSPVFASHFFWFNQKNTSSRHFQASNFPISVPQPAMTRPNGKKPLRHFKGPTEVAWKGLAKARWGMVERPTGWIGTTGRLNLLLLTGR